MQHELEPVQGERSFAGCDLTDGLRHQGNPSKSMRPVHCGADVVVVLEPSKAVVSWASVCPSTMSGSRPLSAVRLSSPSISSGGGLTSVEMG
jgi:hypothetical protein